MNRLFVQKVKEIIATNYQDEQFGLAELCKSLCLSRSQVYRKVHIIEGIGPADLIKVFRLQKSLELLQTTDKSVNEVAYQVGFGDASYFSKIFKAHFGMLPSEVDFNY